MTRLSGTLTRVRRLCAGACWRAALGAALLALPVAAQAAGEVSQTGSEGGYEAKFVDVNGIRTRYFEVGQGEPLLLVHGSGWRGTANANTWIPNLAGLGEHFHVFAVDKLAAGMTGNPEKDEDFTIRGEVRHMYEFIQTMGLGRIHLVGQSRGGGLALFLSVAHPDIIKTLVIVDSATASPEVGDYAARRAKALAHCQGLEGVDYWVCNYKGLSFNPDHVTDEFVAAARFMESQPKVAETRARMAAGAGESREEFGEWKKGVHVRMREEGMLQMPTLLYWGRNDPTAIPAQGRALFDLMGAKNPRVRMILVNNAGHFHFREYPDEFNRNVIHFIKSWSP